MYFTCVCKQPHRHFQRLDLCFHFICFKSLLFNSLFKFGEWCAARVFKLRRNFSVFLVKDYLEQHKLYFRSLTDPLWPELFYKYVFCQKGHWKCYSKGVEQNCFNYSLNMQCINKGHLAVVALSDCQEKGRQGDPCWIIGCREKRLVIFGPCI